MRFIGYAASLTSGFYLLRLLERETISKFAPVYLGRHFQQQPGTATYAPTPLPSTVIGGAFSELS